LFWPSLIWIFTDALQEMGSDVMRRDAEVRGKDSRSLLSIPKHRQSLAEGKLPTLLAGLPSSRSFVSAFNAVATQA